MRGRPPDATTVLSLFAANPRITVAELAHATNRDEPAMRKRLSLMARAGLLAAHKRHPTALAIYTLPGAEVPAEAPTLTDRVLRLVDEEPFVTPAELAGELGQSKKAIRSSIAVLCRRGVVRATGESYTTLGMR